MINISDVVRIVETQSHGDGQFHTSTVFRPLYISVLLWPLCNRIYCKQNEIYESELAKIIYLSVITDNCNDSNDKSMDTEENTKI